MYLNGENTDQHFGVLFMNDIGEWELCHEESTADKAFRWSGFLLDVTTQYIMIIPGTPGLTILEAAFYSNGNHIMPTGYNPEESKALFDEPELVPEYPFFTNSMFFDENLHALTAYEFIHGKPPVEVTHPPLGKILIALGIRIFGMSPFGWRIMCALFGVLLIMPLYALAKYMFGSRLLAFLTAFIFTFDFMRFVQSRIASLDIFLVAFVICMYLFMYKYIQIFRQKDSQTVRQTNRQTDKDCQPIPEERLNKKALLYLGCSGAFMGLAIAVKWSAAFAGLGIGALFAMAWYEARPRYDSQKRNAKLHLGNLRGQNAKEKQEFHDAGETHVGKYKKDLIRTGLWCILFFVVVPMVIYCLSYIPFSRASGLRWPNGIIQNQADMFSHHAYLTDRHEYQSGWWTWPFNIRPMSYSLVALPDGTAGGMVTFGNPVVWWAGVIALIWCLKRWFFDKDKTARFLCISWTAQILPWVFITRSSFIYHYFPCVPFLTLMTVYFIKIKPTKQQWRYALAYGVLALVLFAVFYPVLGGMSASSLDYVKGLQWLPGWRFVG